MTRIEVINCEDDPRVEVFRDVRDRDLRGRDGIFMAESEMVVRRLLRTPAAVHSLLLCPERRARMRDVLDGLPPEIPIYEAPIELMESIAGFHIHRGVLAAGRRPLESHVVIDRLFDCLPTEGNGRVLAASGINNVDNMGGLFRTAAALSVCGVLLGDRCCDPLYRKAIRVSMGHVLSVPWAVHDPLIEGLQEFRSRGWTLVAAETGVDALPVAQWNPPPRMVLVVGAEGSGLTQDVLDLCDQRIEIPMAKGVPSLNVVVAAGILLAHGPIGSINPR